MLESTENKPAQASEPVLDYGCTPWISSSQRSADLYRSGVKLWRKEDLLDIEQQLARSQTTEKFTIRRIDGSVVHIKNPMFGVSKPIWRPYVKFREYWNLVRATPDADMPSELYSCTYLIDWTNQTKRDYEGPVDEARLLFEELRNRWNASATCEAFTSQFRKILDGDANKKVTKIVCFGLGDLNFKPPDCWRIENFSKPKDEWLPETSGLERVMIHHAIALTMADVVRSSPNSGGMGVRLLTQDPQYSDETKHMLRDAGFEVLGDHGAGGFAEVDDTSIVFSAYTKAPVREIITDFARPAVIIINKRSSDTVFSTLGKPYGDPESPRTRDMWKEYQMARFPVPHESEHIEGSLDGLAICARFG
ncbi:hypothetical protein FQN54_006713 [Arachnomyces sp. PD_36]|nr:hypothetical protein FQN54_006713 [Arachnomyces sp. PD_36]